MRGRHSPGSPYSGNISPPRVLHLPHGSSQSGSSAAAVGRRFSWPPAGHLDRAVLGPYLRSGRGRGRRAFEYRLVSARPSALLLVLIWWAWSGHQLYSTRLDLDAVVQRMLSV